MAVKGKQHNSFARALASSPLLVVFGVAAIVVFAISFAGYVRRGGFWSPEVEARVFDQDGRSRGGRAASASSGQRTFAFQGEVYQQAERLRESSALAMVATLVGAQASMQGRPYASVEALMGDVAGGDLLPPGVTVGQAGGVFSSRYGSYYVRYRVEPLGVEVLSIGKGVTPGPPMLIRLPDDEFSQNALTYYVAPQVEGSPVPQAFVPNADIINAGWRPETFKATPVSPEEAARQRAWLNGGAARN